MRIHSVSSRAAAACLAFLFLGVAAPATAFFAEAGHTVWTSEETLLFDTPRQNSKVEGHLPVGSEVKLLSSHDGMSGRWWEVWWNGKTGWVREKVLTAEAPKAPEPAAPAAAIPAQATEPASAATDAAAAAPVPAMPATPSPPQDRSADIARLMAHIKTGSVEDRTHACQLLPYSGLTDAALFDALDGWLKDRYARQRNRVQVEDDVPRCVQGLASSGNNKYLPTIELWNGGRNNPSRQPSGTKL